MKIYDAAVIGLGCAGIGAYLQIKKESEKVLLIERQRVGGDIFYARLVENLLFSKGIRGEDACRLMEKQIGSGKVIKEECLSITGEEEIVAVKTNKREYLCRYALIATGREQKRIGFIEGEQKHFASEAKGDKICIIGGGERALDCAASLIEKGKKVFVLSTGSFSKVNATLMKESSKAVLYRDSAVKEIFKAEKYTVKFECGGRVLKKEFDDLIISTGTEKRLPKINPKSRDRILHAGSVRGKHLSQCALAFADGVRVGEHIANRIRRENESNGKQEN